MVPPHKSQELYQTLVETTGTGYVVVDASGKVLDANQEYVRLTGYRSLDEIRGKGVVEWTAAYEKEKNRNAIKQCLRDGQIRGFEVDYVDSAGKITSIEVNATVVEEEGKKHILTLCRDVTERKRLNSALRQAESRLRSIIHVAPVGIGMVSNRILLQVNDLLCQMTGYSPDELLGKSARVLYPDEEEFNRVGKEKYVQISNAGSGTVETKWRRKDGTIIDIILSSSALDKNDLAAGVIFTALDITQRKQAVEKITQSVSLLHAALESTADGILVVDTAGTFTSYNEKFIQMWRLPLDIINSKDDKRALAYVLDQLKDPNVFLSKVKELYSHPEAESYDLLEFKDGRIFERYSGPQKVEGRPVGRVWSFRDISERKNTEQALRDSEEKFRRIFDESPLGMITSGQDFHFLRANPAFCAMMGYTEQELHRLTFRELTHPDDVSHDIDSITKLYRGEVPVYRVEKRYIRKDKKILWANVTISIIRDKEGKFISYLGMIEDITDRKKSEQELLEWKKRYELISAASGQLVYDYDLCTGVIAWGGSVQKVLGYRPEEMTGGIEQWIDLINPADRDRAVRLLEAAERNFLPYEVEYGFRHKGGNYVKFLDRGFFIPVPGGKPVRMVGTMQDITARKETEEQLRQAYEQLKETQKELIENEKMAALGRFAAGIAHEMKNPLGIMMGGLEFIERTAMGQDASTRDAIAKVKNAMHRGDAIIQNLLVYSRPAENKVTTIRAADLVNEALASFKYKTVPLKSKIKARLDDTICVEVDVSKIHQVLFNLLDNAVDAVAESGQIEISVYSSVVPDFSPEPACIIEVADTGMGIAEDSFPKLFEPFFTTKLESKGTGLGLFMAKSIIDSHSGKISVDSKLNKGTTVKVVLKQAPVKTGE